MSVKLPLVQSHARELETCGYCPKLCRATCTVASVEPRESRTPWGMMSTTWLAARGDLPLDPSIAELPYACCGCLRCTDFCAHDNPVHETLLAARAEFRARGATLDRVEQALARFDTWQAGQDRFGALAALGRAGGSTKTLLVAGCSYLRHAEPEAVDAVRSAVRLFGGVEVWTECCGLYPRQAGDLAGAEAARKRLARAAGGKRLLVADAGCALELADLGPLTLAEAGAEALERLGVVPELAGERVRYHDPCRASRGARRSTLAPRQILERALGRPPEEFDRREQGSACSGGGGLLPVSFPELSKAIGRERVAEHERLGGGLIVTSCASSLNRFRSLGARALDIAAVLYKSLRAGSAR